MKIKTIEQIMSKLEEELSRKGEENLVDEIFDERTESLHIYIKGNVKYKKSTEKIRQIDDEIKMKYGDKYREIIQLIEKYEDAVVKDGTICEKLMYKHGVLDGMKLILDGTRQIDIKKFLKDNKQY